MKILITGSNGLLGQKLVEFCLAQQVPFLATSIGANRNLMCPVKNYQTLDITDEKNLFLVLKRFAPTHIIHTAAITNVDDCEINAAQCDLVNRQSVQLLAKFCAQNSCHLQLLSTDFVFDGQAGPYKETDQPNPLSVYARSKHMAEQILQSQHNLNYSIVRTILVYGFAENLSRSNLILWAKTALQSKEPIQIVDDQFRAPTWASDLAWACLRICQLNEEGIFHICGPETLSIFQIVQRIADFYQLEMAHVSKVSSAMLQQAAPRPPRTGFVLDKAQKVLGYKPHTLEQTLNLLR